MTVAAYIRQSRWIRRAYAAPRSKFHPVVKRIPRPVHRVLDAPKTIVEEAQK